MTFSYCLSKERKSIQTCSRRVYAHVGGEGLQNLSECLKKCLIHGTITICAVVDIIAYIFLIHINL